MIIIFAILEQKYESILSILISYVESFNFCAWIYIQNMKNFLFIQNGNWATR